MHKLIEKIIKDKVPCYFVSPHFDDAAFSSGGLISYLSDKTCITVINVFTSSGDGKNTFSAKAYLKQCYSTDPQRLFNIRSKEDDMVFSRLKLRVINLGFTDGLWRKIERPGIIRSVMGRFLPEFNSLYPTYRFHVVSGKIHKEDDGLKDRIKNKLRDIIGKKPGQVIVFCPLGFGNHVDHLIIRDVCKKYFGNNLVYWSDFPYYWQTKNSSLISEERNEFIKASSLTKFVFRTMMDVKKQLCELYSSQVDQVVKDKTWLYKQETYYLKDIQTNHYRLEISKTVDSRLLREWGRLWERSALKHYFNSPTWFLACQRTFNYTKAVVIRCYQSRSLVGVLPLVLTKRYGVLTYGFPGDQYLAKSPILLASADTRILDVLIGKIRGLGNYYLTEIAEELLNFSYLAKYKAGVARSSSCSFLPLSPDPYLYLSSYNRKRLIKKIEEERGRLKFKQSAAGFEEDLKLMISIETESAKAKEFKDALSDPILRRLYLNLGRLNKISFLNYFLYYNGEPICYRSGFICGDTYHGGGTAYKADYSHLVPGKISVFLLLPELVKMGIRVADFSRGANPLKRDFTPYTYEQYSLFYSSNFLTMIRWAILSKLKNFLEDHHDLFEVIRKGKKKMSLKIAHL